MSRYWPVPFSSSYKNAARSLIPALERTIGRHRLIRVANFVLNEARGDGPNGMHRNGELLIQQAVVDTRADPMVVLDIGANVGEWSSKLLERSHATDLQLHLFEPSAKCVNHLERRFQTPHSPTLTINQLAASDVEGETVLFKPHELAGSSSLYRSIAQEVEIPESVSTITIDGYCRRHAIRHVDLMKIDTEGHDFQVILGSAGMLRAKAVSLLQFEYNWRWIDARNYLRDVFELVQPFGYMVGKVTQRGVEWNDAWDPRLESWAEANYCVALPWIARRIKSRPWWGEHR